MTISENIFRLINERNIKQKEFSQLTGISESTICDWKRKATNPSSDKIMIICEVLGVSPYELLSTCETKKLVQTDSITVDKNSDEYEVVRIMRECDAAVKNRIIGYAQATADEMNTKKAAVVKAVKETVEAKPEVKKAAKAPEKKPAKAGKATTAKAPVTKSAKAKAGKAATAKAAPIKANAAKTTASKASKPAAKKSKSKK